MADHFWLSAGQWAAIEPHIPKVCTGKRRVDDRWVISGIVHRLREGCRWRVLSEVYGPYTTMFNRYNRWIHIIVDEQGRPPVHHLTAGQASDIVATASPSAVPSP